MRAHSAQDVEALRQQLSEAEAKLLKSGGGPASAAVEDLRHDLAGLRGRAEVSNLGGSGTTLPEKGYTILTVLPGMTWQGCRAALRSAVGSNHRRQGRGAWPSLSSSSQSIYSISPLLPSL